MLRRENRSALSAQRPVNQSPIGRRCHSNPEGVALDPTTRHQNNRTQAAYIRKADLTDAEWAIIAPAWRERRHGRRMGLRDLIGEPVRPA